MLTADDRLDIIELVARYNRAIDSRDAEAWANTFTVDGVFNFVGRHEVRGQAALAQHVRGMRDNERGFRHSAINLVIEGDGDTATMLADFVGIVDQRISMTGRYHNELRKVDGAWRFTLREYTNDPVQS